MLGPIGQPESPYKKQLRQIARMAQYQPIASIPQPSVDFNYTISRNRYSQYYQNPKVIKKPIGQSHEKLKLTTILETHGGKSPLFPKIGKVKNMSGEGVNSSSKGRVKGLRSHFKKQQETTVTSRQRSLTIDTRLDSEENRRNANESQLIERSEIMKDNLDSLRNSSINRNLTSHSGSSDFSAIIHRRDLGQSSHHSKWSNSQLVSYQDVLNEQQQDEDQYQKNAIPGPGTYDYTYSDFDKKRNTRSTDVSFLSKLTRFNYKGKVQEQSPKEVVNPLQVERQEARERRLHQNIRRKVIPFNALSPRKFQCDQKANRYPGPQDYYPRLGMQEDLIRSIQHQFKGNFGHQEVRFDDSKLQNEHLGPGCYDRPPAEDILVGENFYFKSRQERFVQ